MQLGGLVFKQSIKGEIIMGQSKKSLKTTRIIFAVGLVVSILLSMGLIALMWFGYAIITVRLIGGFLVALVASFFLTGDNSNMIVWIIFIAATIDIMFLMLVWFGDNFRHTQSSKEERIFFPLSSFFSTSSNSPILPPTS
jgi:hypothetical protein